MKKTTAKLFICCMLLLFTLGLTSCSCIFCKYVAPADDGDCSTPVVCIFCGKETVAAKTHDFSSEYVTNRYRHWHECQNEGCKISNSRTKHTPNQEKATIFEPKMCTECGYILAEQLPHECSATVSKYDFEGHWLECICGKILPGEEKQEHVYTNDGDCTTAVSCRCGYTVKQAAAAHIPTEDDGNCLTAVKCQNCDHKTTEAEDAHTDTDGDFVCDNPGCQVTLPGAEADENPGIDFPIDRN